MGRQRSYTASIAGSSPALPTMNKDNEYRRLYNLRRYHKIRGGFIEELGGKCVMCGKSENLHFDHINPKTLASSLTGKATL